MDIKIFQLFHKHNNFKQPNSIEKTENNSTKTNDAELKKISDAMTSIGRADISFQAKKISPEIAKKIIEKSKDGISIEDIVVALGGIVSITTVSNILTQNAENEKIIEMYQDGAPLSSIQYNLGISIRSIIERLKKHPDYEKFNTERQKNCRRTKITDDMVFKMEALFKDNFTIERIAMELGCSENAVSYNLQKLPNWEELKAKHSKKNEKTILTPEFIEEMVKKYESGASLSQIGKEMGCAHSFVRSTLRKQANWEEIEAKHNQNSNVKKTTPETVQKILELYKEKKSFQEIAEIIGSNRTTVREQLQKLDNWKEIEAEYGTNEKIPEETINKIVELYKAGKNLSVIGRKVRVSTSSTREIIQQHPDFAEIEKEHLKNTKNMNTKSIPEEIVAKMAEEYKEGKTGREIAKLYGYSQTGLMERLRLLSDWEEIQASHKINASMTYISPETAKEMQKLYEQKISTREIGRRFNCSKTSVIRALKKLNNFDNLKELAEEKMNNKKTTPEMKEKMEELFRQGLSCQKIGKELNCSKTNVRNHLITLENWSEIQAEHLKNTTFTVITTEIIDKMINLYKQGKNTWQIGIILDINKSTISRYINNQENKDEIKKEHITNLSSEKKKTLEEIISLYKENTPIEDICKRTGYPLFVVKRIINIDVNSIEYKKTTEEKNYQTKTPEELQTRIIDFYINNDEIKNETLNNIIYFLDSNEQVIKEENKEILVQFCKDIDKIEQYPENINKIIETSACIPIIQSWLRDYEESGKALEIMHENIGILHGQFASNLLADTYSYFENLIPSDTDSIENINAFNNIIKDISSRLENPTKTNKNSVHNLVLYHYYAQSSEDEACMRLENAITNYNKIYNKTLSLEEIEKEDNITKERIGQIINITNILDGTAISTELANEYQEFIEIFKDKTQIKNRAIQSLVILENYFNSDNKDKYLYKHFEPICKECILDQEIMKVFMDKIYMYSYNSVGPDEIKIELQDSVLNDTNWEKLQPKEKADFIRTMENGIIDRSPKSKGRFNIIKYEGKAKNYQIVELKIDSKWRIFGYQDPNNSKKFIFDTIGLDAKGLEKYQKEFFKSHNL